MPRFSNSAVNILLILFAVSLSLFNGFFSALSGMVFSGNERTSLLVSIYVPAALWIPAIACWWLPKSGFVTYAVILGSAIFLCVDPFHQSHIRAALVQCSVDLRFALAGAALLFVNVFVPREPEGDGAR